MAAARVARLLLRHPHAPAVVRAATTARPVCWPQAVADDPPEKAKEHLDDLSQACAKRFETRGIGFRMAVAQCDTRMYTPTVSPTLTHVISTHTRRAVAPGSSLAEGQHTAKRHTMQHRDM